MSIPRRSIALAALTALALVAAGCSPAGSDQEASGSGDAVSSAGFPVTVEHVYGETEIPERPERVVTLGWLTHDIVAGLGVAPVGVPTTWGGDEEGFAPWFRDQIDELGAEMPEILVETEDGPDYEQILSLQPDVILAPHSGVTEVQYERLSEIAPTVAYADAAWSSGTWQDLTGLVAETLGETERGEELIAETEEMIADEAAQYDNLDGTSFLYSATLTDGSTEVAAYITGDPRVSLLHEFGLVDSPDLAPASEGIDPDIWYTGFSLEELDTVETDLFVAWSNSAEDTAYSIDHSVFSRWEPISEGRYYIIEDTTLGMATSGPDVLSIPWAIEQGYMADISEAIDGGAVVRGTE